VGPPITVLENSFRNFRRIRDEVVIISIILRGSF